MAFTLRLISRGCAAGALKSYNIKCMGISQQCVRALFTSAPTTSKPQAKLVEGEDFWDKNSRLKRPMSPHMTIYAPQLTAILSVTHRGTGMALWGILTAFAWGTAVLPNNYPHYVELLSSLHFGPAIFFCAKAVLAYPLVFHAANGIRHLFWDAGYGFNMGVLYKTGYAVCLVASLGSIAIACL